MNELLTINEVAELCGLHRAIIYRYVKKGKIPYVSIFKTEDTKRETIRFERDAIIAHLNKIRKKAVITRTYNIPQYVMTYLKDMATSHKNTPDNILKFISGIEQ